MRPPPRAPLFPYTTLFRSTAADVRVDASGAHFTMVGKEGRHPVSLPLLGRFNVANALGVAACAIGLEVPSRVVAERLSTAPQDRKSTRLNSSHRCISYAVF